MANLTQSNDSHSQAPAARGGAARPVEKVTVKSPSEPDARSATGRKKGWGGLVAMLTIPGLILLVLILAYFFLSALKSNTEEKSQLDLRDEATSHLASAACVQAHEASWLVSHGYQARPSFVSSRVA
jgi:hypothetical protein